MSLYKSLFVFPFHSFDYAFGCVQNTQQRQQLSEILVSAFSFISFEHRCFRTILLYTCVCVHIFECSSFYCCCFVKQNVSFCSNFKRLQRLQLHCVSISIEMRAEGRKVNARQRWINILKRTEYSEHRKESNEIIMKMASTATTATPVTKALGKKSTVYTIFESASETMLCRLQNV